MPAYIDRFTQFQAFRGWDILVFRTFIIYCIHNYTYTYNIIHDSTVYVPHFVYIQATKTTGVFSWFMINIIIMYVNILYYYYDIIRYTQHTLLKTPSRVRLYCFVKRVCVIALHIIIIIPSPNRQVGCCSIYSTTRLKGEKNRTLAERKTCALIVFGRNAFSIY